MDLNAEYSGEAEPSVERLLNWKTVLIGWTLLSVVISIPALVIHGWDKPQILLS